MINFIKDAVIAFVAVSVMAFLVILLAKSLPTVKEIENSINYSVRNMDTNVLPYKKGRR